MTTFATSRPLDRCGFMSRVLLPVQIQRVVSRVNVHVHHGRHRKVHESTARGIQSTGSTSKNSPIAYAYDAAFIVSLTRSEVTDVTTHYLSTYSMLPSASATRLASIRSTLTSICLKGSPSVCGVSVWVGGAVTRDSRQPPCAV